MLKKLTYEQLKAKVKELENQKTNLEFRVGTKGGVSVYGLGRFPVTLYYEQWQLLLDNVDNLKSFLGANKNKMKLKGEK